jgi:2'-5' RNA ligase
MAQGLVVFFDDEAEAAIRALWRRLDDAGVPSLLGHANGRFPPHLTYAMAGTIPRGARTALREDLAQLWLPDLWLHTLAVLSSTENVLMLSAVVDSELLAVHSAVHDALAGKVKNPSAYYLPGTWVPHCTLAQGITDEQIVAGIAALHPVEPIRAKVRQVAIVDSRTAEIEPLTC